MYCIIVYAWLHNYNYTRNIGLNYRFKSLSTCMSENMYNSKCLFYFWQSNRDIIMRKYYLRRLRSDDFSFYCNTIYVQSRAA